MKFMKYFNFFCKLDPELSCDSDYYQAILEASIYCGYLGRMYEFLFPKTRTNNVSSLTVLLVSKLPQTIWQQESSSIDLYNVFDWHIFTSLKSEEKALYIIKLCQSAILKMAEERGWDLVPFEIAYEKIKEAKGLFRSYYKKPVFSPDKQLKAQIYFEDDYEKNGTYVDFTDKKGTLVKRVQFTPRGYSVYSQDIGVINWDDNFQVKIFYIQTPRAGLNYEVNMRDYWIVTVDGRAEFYYSRGENIEVNPHKLFNLGVLYWEGKIIIQDKEKGFALIKKSAELKYKHAQIWLKRTIDS